MSLPPELRDLPDDNQFEDSQSTTQPWVRYAAWIALIALVLPGIIGLIVNLQS